MFSSIVRIFTTGWFGSISRTALRSAAACNRGSPDVRSTTESWNTGSTVSACRYGKYISALASVSSPCNTSPTTPTISIYGTSLSGVAPICIRLPKGFSPGK